MMNESELDKKRFDSLFYGSETAMVIFRGSEMIVEMFNKKYHEIYQHRDILGKSLFDTVTELKQSKFPSILKNVYETGETYVSHEGVAHILNPKSGELEERYFDTTFSRITFDDGEFRILATPKEVTERVRYRQQLEHSLKELEDEREFRELFISALTHDLRTPLSILKLSAEILAKREKEYKDVKSLAEKMIESVNNTDKMISDLLDVDRIRAGEWLSVSLKENCLKNILTLSIDELSKIYPERLICKIQDSSFNGRWDRIAIQRMIENLVSNAIKYGTPKTPVTINLSKEENNNIMLSVHNWGQPIPPEEIETIFTKHRRASTAIKSGSRGWGIGLALVKGLTEAHGGKVGVVSCSELGTTFYFQLPS